MVAGTARAAATRAKRDWQAARPKPKPKPKPKPNPDPDPTPTPTPTPTPNQVARDSYAAALAAARVAAPHPNASEEEVPRSALEGQLVAVGPRRTAAGRRAAAGQRAGPFGLPAERQRVSLIFSFTPNPP